MSRRYVMFFEEFRKKRVKIRNYYILNKKHIYLVSFQQSPLHFNLDNWRYKFTTTVVILSKQQSFGANFDCTPWLLKRLKTRRGTGRRTGRLHLAHLYKILAKILRSDFSTAGCSKEARNAAWRTNSAEVSAVSDILRTEECQKHWHIIKSEARRNTRKQREAMTATGKSY